MVDGREVAEGEVGDVVDVGVAEMVVAEEGEEVGGVVVVEVEEGGELRMHERSCKGIRIYTNIA
jgi:hypothetical protein